MRCLVVTAVRETPNCLLVRRHACRFSHFDGIGRKRVRQGVNLPENPTTADGLEKQTIADLRRAGFEEDQLRIALIRYFASGLLMGLSSGVLLDMLFKQPGCIAAKAVFAEVQAKRLFSIAQQLPLCDILSEAMRLRGHAFIDGEEV